MQQMTLVNESVTFSAQGIWIQPLLSDGFWFTGSVDEFLAILINHTELDITKTTFRVRA